MRIETTEQFLPALDELALSSPEATFYHTGAWLQSLSQSFTGLGFRCLVAWEGGDLAGYLPFFLSKRGPFETAWSLPFGTYGGPVGLGSEPVRRELARAYGRLRAGRNVHEVGLVDFSNQVSIDSFRVSGASTHVVELAETFADTWEKRVEKSKRRQARKAVKEGLSVAEASSPAEVSEYYSIYARRMAGWGERFRYPERLFAALFAAGGGKVRLFVARRGDEMLGGHLNLYFRDTVIAWNGVVRDTADGTQASTLLYAECIKHACDNGYRWYNLGGSLGKETLVDYKQSIGGVPYHYHTVLWRSPAGRVAVLIKNVLSQR
jgi:hypothetical protein